MKTDDRISKLEKLHECQWKSEADELGFIVAVRDQLPWLLDSHKKMKEALAWYSEHSWTVTVEKHQGKSPGAFAHDLGVHAIQCLEEINK